MTSHDEPLTICPMFEEPCRHCSIEKATGVCTKLKQDPRTQMLVSDGLETSTLTLGAWCNNDGNHWVKDLKVCPAKWGLTRPGKEVAAVKKVKKPNVTRTGRYAPTSREMKSGAWSKKGRRLKYT